MNASVSSCQLQMRALTQNGVRHRQAHPTRTQIGSKDELMGNLGKCKAQAILIMETSAFLLMLCFQTLEIEIQCYSSLGRPCYGNIAYFIPYRLYSSTTTIQSLNLFSCY